MIFFSNTLSLSICFPSFSLKQTDSRHSVSLQVSLQCKLMDIQNHTWNRKLINIVTFPPHFRKWASTQMRAHINISPAGEEFLWRWKGVVSKLKSAWTGSCCQLYFSMVNWTTSFISNWNEILSRGRGFIFVLLLSSLTHSKLMVGGAWLSIFCPIRQTDDIRERLPFQSGSKWSDFD